MAEIPENSNNVKFWCSIDDWNEIAKDYTLNNSDLLGSVVYRVMNALHCVKLNQYTIKELLDKLGDIHYELERAESLDSKRSEELRRIIYGLAQSVEQALKAIATRPNVSTENSNPQNLFMNAMETVRMDSTMVSTENSNPQNLSMNAMETVRMDSTMSIGRSADESFSSMNQMIKCLHCTVLLWTMKDYFEHTLVAHNMTPMQAGCWFMCDGCGLESNSPTQMHTHLQDAEKLANVTCKAGLRFAQGVEAPSLNIFDPFRQVVDVGDHNHSDGSSSIMTEPTEAEFAVVKGELKQLKKNNTLLKAELRKVAPPRRSMKGDKNVEKEAVDGHRRWTKEEDNEIFTLLKTLASTVEGKQFSLTGHKMTEKVVTMSPMLSSTDPDKKRSAGAVHQRIVKLFRDENNQEIMNAVSEIESIHQEKINMNEIIDLEQEIDL